MHDICHVEIKSTDLEASKGFLSGVFGWEFVEMDPHYWLFRTPDGPGGGLEKVENAMAVGGIGIYVQVGSIEDTCEKVPELGGSVVRPRSEIGHGYGAYAILRDPGGTEIGIWEGSA